MTLHHLDHLVLTVRDLDATCAFYRLLGMEVIAFDHAPREFVAVEHSHG
jgi:catechol 2,3-dioxygenase-like lactoylglutathione lyase family enzyme